MSSRTHGPFDGSPLNYPDPPDEEAEFETVTAVYTYARANCPRCSALVYLKPVKISIDPQPTPDSEPIRVEFSFPTTCPSCGRVFKDAKMDSGIKIYFASELDEEIEKAGESLKRTLYYCVKEEGEYDVEVE